MKFFNTPEKERIHQDTDRKTIFNCIKRGIQSALKNPNKAAILAAYTLTAIAGCFLLSPDGETAFAVFGSGLHKLSYIPAAIIGLLCLFYVYGRPKGAQAVRDSLTRAGVVNHAGEAPTLTDRQQDPDNPKVEICILDANGVSVSELEDHRAEVESALNVHITQIKQGENKGQIKFCCVSGNTPTQDKIDWKDDYLSKNCAVFVVGENAAGEKVIINLAVTPHLLVSGSTGSGKSVTVRLISHQALLLGVEVLIVDFKGGLDYGAYFRNHEHCNLVTDPKDFARELRVLHGKMLWRLKQIEQAGCKNIDEYNLIADEPFQRCLMVIDEVAELTDLTGLDTAERKKVLELIGLLSSITRLSRAAGIHILYSTQRADANISPGQISNNIDFRACARANDVLSRLTLGNGDADKLIPKDSRGVFLTNDGVLFRAYFFDDNQKNGGANE